MPTIHNDTVTAFHLRAPEPDDVDKAREQGRAPKVAVRKTLGPQSSVHVTERELDALLSMDGLKKRLEQVGGGKYRVRDHVGVAGDFDREIRAKRREKARAEARAAAANEDVDTLKKRIEALESQATADKPKAVPSAPAGGDDGDDGGKPKGSSGGKGGGGKKQG